MPFHTTPEDARGYFRSEVSAISSPNRKPNKPPSGEPSRRVNFYIATPIEAFGKALSGNAVGVEAAEVLETFGLTGEVGEVEGLGELAFVGTIE